MSSQFPAVRLRRFRKSSTLRTMFQEVAFDLNDLVLPIFVEEGVSDFGVIASMPGVLRIPESKLAGEIERYARAGIRAVIDLRYLALQRPGRQRHVERGRAGGADGSDL